MWHINNEYGCHVYESFTPAATAAWRAWLQGRYHTIGTLNEAWGTAFWSQRYDDWSEIHPPRTAPTFVNPTQQLDWRRFSSDALFDLYKMEIDILRRVTPDVPVVTNFMGFFKPLDYWKWAQFEDVVSDDNYPDPLDPHAHVLTAARSDLMRSLRHGQPWILMEQTPSAVNWRERNALKRPNQMRLWSYQALSRGANGILFFQWRAARAGAEKFHSGMVPHAGADTRVHREIKHLGDELKRLADLRTTTVRADVALVFDWDNWWALELESHPSIDMNGWQFAPYYSALHQRNIAVDFVPSTIDDLSRYRLVVVPNLYLTRQGVAEVFENYVAGGGTLIIGPFSGISDEDDHIRLGGYPAPFRKVLGIRIEEFDALGKGQSRRIITDDEDSFGRRSARNHAERLRPRHSVLCWHRAGLGRVQLAVRPSLRPGQCLRADGRAARRRGRRTRGWRETVYLRADPWAGARSCGVALAHARRDLRRDSPWRRGARRAGRGGSHPALTYRGGARRVRPSAPQQGLSGASGNWRYTVPHGRPGQAAPIDG
jgi:beta-galactosidase